MKIITPGHSYALDNHQGRGEPQHLHFIHKEPIKEGSKQLRTIRVGTTNEEVLEALIDRVKFLDGRMPCRENHNALMCLLEAQEHLLSRTQRRTEAGVEGTNERRADESASNDLVPPPAPVIPLPASTEELHEDEIGFGSVEIRRATSTGPASEENAS